MPDIGEGAPKPFRPTRRDVLKIPLFIGAGSIAYVFNQALLSGRMFDAAQYIALGGAAANWARNILPTQEFKALHRAEQVNTLGAVAFYPQLATAELALPFMKTVQLSFFEDALFDEHVYRASQQRVGPDCEKAITRIETCLAELSLSVRHLPEQHQQRIIENMNATLKGFLFTELYNRQFSHGQQSLEDVVKYKKANNILFALYWDSLVTGNQQSQQGQAIRDQMNREFPGSFVNMVTQFARNTGEVPLLAWQQRGKALIDRLTKMVESEINPASPEGDRRVKSAAAMVAFAQLVSDQIGTHNPDGIQQYYNFGSSAAPGAVAKEIKRLDTEFRQWATSSNILPPKDVDLMFGAYQMYYQYKHGQGDYAALG